MGQDIDLNRLEDLIAKMENADFRVAQEAVHEIKTMIRSIDDRAVIQTVLDTMKRKGPDWIGTGSLSDQALLLTILCEEKITRMSTLPELFAQYDSRNHRLSEFAFGEIDKRARSCYQLTVLALILERLEGSLICASSYGRLTEKNIDELKEFCKKRIDELKNPTQMASVGRAKPLGYVTERPKR